MGDVISILYTPKAQVCCICPSSCKYSTLAKYSKLGQITISIDSALPFTSRHAACHYTVNSSQGKVHVPAFTTIITTVACHHCKSLLFVAINSRQVTSLVSCIFSYIVTIPFTRAVITIALQLRLQSATKLQLYTPSY